MNGQTMKTLPEELRPYERLEAFGAEALSDTELLAVLLKSGSRRKTAAEVAADVLCRCGGLSGLDGMSVPALSEVEGIGRAKAVTLLAAYELGLRICRSDLLQRRVAGGHHGRLACTSAVPDQGLQHKQRIRL